MEVVTTAAKILSRLKRIYDEYAEREHKHKDFEQFFKLIIGQLDAIPYEHYPPHSVPVLQCIVKLLADGVVSIKQYENRDPLNAAYKMGAEEEHLSSIEWRVQPLLSLLATTMSFAANIEAAKKLVQQSINDAMKHQNHQLAMQLERLKTAVVMMSLNSVTSEEVQRQVTTLVTSTLDQNCAQPGGEVKLSMSNVNLALRTAVMPGVFKKDMQGIRTSIKALAKDVRAVESKLSSQIDGIMRNLLSLANVDDGTIQLGKSTIIKVVADLELDDLAGLEDTLIDSHDIADRVRKKIMSGGLRLFACWIVGLPLRTAGQLQPVSLPCCGVVVSYIGAKQLLTMETEKYCPLCKTPLCSQSQVMKADEMVIRAIQAEDQGVGARRLDQSQVRIGEILAHGGQGIVYHGQFEGEEVAVKTMNLPSKDWREMDSVRHVLCVSHFAATFSRNICQMKGYFVAENKLWIVLEKCECTLEEHVEEIFVRSGRQEVGLHPLQVIDVGLMLCSALAALHRGARSLHLDVTPRNVLLKTVTSASDAASTTGGTASGGAPQQMIALLSDFGMSRLVPACVSTKFESRSTSPVPTMVQGVGKGTSGYAPKEQVVDGKGRRRSDVYGLGATLAFALTGQRPYQHVPVDQIEKQLCAGIPMQVRSVDPPELTQLIKDMVKVKGDERPHLTDVYRRLLGMKGSSSALRETDSTVYNRFLIAPDFCSWTMPEPPGLAGQSVHASDHGRGGRAADAIPIALTDILGGSLNRGKRCFLYLQPPPGSVYAEDQIQYLHMSGFRKDRRDDLSEYMYTKTSAPEDMHLSFELDEESTSPCHVLISAVKRQAPSLFSTGRPARRFLAAHKSDKADQIYGATYIRLLAHDWKNRAGIWRFVEIQGRRVLQVCGHNSGSMDDEGVLYLTWPQLAVRDDTSQYVAVTNKPSDAWTVAVEVPGTLNLRVWSWLRSILSC